MNQKPFTIPKKLVYTAWKRVQASKGGPGIDGITIEQYESNLGNNLYKLWNRMSSGSYFPPPVKQVEIPKDRGVRILGVPTVEDRIAQTVVRLQVEPELEYLFLNESYGARPTRSAHDALAACRQNCFRYGWAVDLDIKGFYDNICHKLLIKAVTKHTHTKWEQLYIERWLKAGTVSPTGHRQPAGDVGIPQGATISPALSNLFLHYALDRWLKQNSPDLPFERFLDDCVVHCNSEAEAVEIKGAIASRLAEVGLELNQEKTKVVQCYRSEHNLTNDSNKSFTFLSYDFKPRPYRTKHGQLAITFTPAVATKAKNKLHKKLRQSGALRRTDWTIEEVAAQVNPLIRGWHNYFSRYRPSECQEPLYRVNRLITKWLRSKYKLSRKGAMRRFERLLREQPELFHQWRLGVVC